MKKVYNEMAGEMMIPKNAIIHTQLAMLEIATLECEALGLEVETVEWFDNSRPRLVVKDCATLRHLMKQNKAFNYGSEVKNGTRFYLNQMMLKGVKIIWKSDSLKH